MKKKQIILPKLRYENAPEVDNQIRIGFEEEKSLLRNDDRNIVLDLAEQFATERAESKRYKLYGKIKMVFRNLYCGVSPYEYLRERLSLSGDGSDSDFSGFLPYDEFAFLRNDIYYETPEPQVIDVLSGFTNFNLITSGSTEHQTITTLIAPYFNWNVYLSYIYSHDVDFPMKYTLSGNTIPALSFVSGDGIPFRVEETINSYVLTSPVKHGMTQGEHIIIGGKYYYINSVGNEIYRSEEYVINILKSQVKNITFNTLVTGKRCSDIKDINNSTSEYYVHKHKTLTLIEDYILDKVGFESPIWREEQKILYENSAGENDVLVTRNRMESVLFDFKEPFILTGITNNLGYTPTELYISIIFRNGNGYFNYPPKVGYSFHMHDTWIDEHFDGDSSLETGLTYSSFIREGVLFNQGNVLPSGGTELLGAFIEYNPKEMKERVISEVFHKIISNPLVFDHAQMSSELYYGATETNPLGMLYQPHHRYKIRELSPYIESSDISAPMENLPENALYFPEEKVWRWRDLYDDGYIDPDGYGTDYPYMNNIHYIHRNINFYLINEQIYTTKKDGVVSFYSTIKRDECDDNTMAYLRAGQAPSPVPAISPSPYVEPSPTPSTSTIIITEAYYISPYGSDSLGNGSFANPWFSLNKAWENVSAGNTIYMMGGVYEYPDEQHLSNKSGIADAYINIWAYPDQIPVINPSAYYEGNVGVTISGVDYLYVRGLDISQFTQRTSDEWYSGIIAADVNNCIFEQLNVHHNGFGMSLQVWTIGNHVSGNLFLNCDFHHNYDNLTDIEGNLPYGGADGLTIRINDPISINTIQGCRMYNNSDDGFDGWYNSGLLIFENCWSFNNGYREDGITIGGDGNGFKMGPLVPPPWTGYEGQHKRTMYNCMAFNNRGTGFDQNAALCIMYFINNTSYNNGGYGFFMTYDDVSVITAKNNIAFANQQGQAYFNSASIVDHNTWDSPVIVTNDDFVSIDATGTEGTRNSNGSLPTIDFLKLSTLPISDLIGAGTPTGLLTDAAGNPWNDPPSMGTYEIVGTLPTPSVTRSVTPSLSISATPSLSVSSTTTPSTTPTMTITRSITITPTPSISATPESSVSATPSLSISSTQTPTTTPSTTPTITTSISISATPSLSISATQTPSLSISATPSLSISATPSLSISATPSLSISETPSLSVSSTQTPTITPTPSESPTPGLSPSVTPSETPSLSVSSTQTPSVSISATPTPSVSETPSMTPTTTPSLSISATPSLSISETPSMTPTTTPSLSISATPSLSISKTPSITPTKTSSPSISVTPSISLSVTRTPSLSISRTPTTSISATPSLSISRTPSLSISATPSLSISKTPSITPTRTPSISISTTPSRTPVATRTPTSTRTQTPSVSGTPGSTTTPTLTATPSITISRTFSITPSATPSRTSSVTPSKTVSRTPLATVTMTPTVTRTSSMTPTLGASRTPTPTSTVTPTRTLSRTPTRTPSITPSTSWTSMSGYYYVSSATGIDDPGRNGSITQPWATLHYAISRVTIGGSTIYMLAGNYSESTQMNLTSNVNIMGAGRNVVTITMTYNASEYYPCLKLESPSGWGNPAYGNQNISGIKFNGNLTGSIAIGVNFRSNVHIFDCEFVDFAERAVFFSGQPSYDWGLDNPYNDKSSSEYGLMPDANGWCTGNKFYDNIVTNCARFVTSDHHTGAVCAGTQDGFEAYGNDINSYSRRGYGIKFWDLGYNKNSDIHDNIIETYPLLDGVRFEFAIEWWWGFGGDRFYNNRLRGALDFVNMVDDISAGYSAIVYNNNIGRDTTPTSLERGILLEGKIEYVQIYRNHIHHVARAIYVPRNNYTITDRLFHVDINSNLMVNLGQTGTNWQTWGIHWSDAVSDEGTTSYFKTQNNVIHALPSSTLGFVTAYGIMLPRVNRMTDVYVDNNIIINFYGGAIFGSETRALASNLIIRNNVLFGNGYSNGLNFDTNFTNTVNTSGGYVYSGTIPQDPQFVAIGSNYHISSTSPAYHAGVYVGLSLDYDSVSWNNPPSIGAYEYMGGIQPSLTPQATRSMTPSISPSRTPSISFTRTPTRTPSKTPAAGANRTFYVKNGGNDSLDGLSDANAWATISKVNSAGLIATDVVRLKRGSVWREERSLIPSSSGSASGYITFSDYGTGNKPLLLGSIQANSTSNWVNVGTNLWRNSSSSFSSVKVGNLIFNNESSWGVYKTSQAQVTSQGNFFFDVSNHWIILYSVGNPATYYSNIECALDRVILFLNSGQDYLIFENLDVRYSAGHGLDAWNGCSNIIIRDCNFRFIGGSEFSSPEERYGNAIQFWGSSSDITIERNTFSDIFDAAITPQYDGTGNIVINNWQVRNNLINTSEYSFEHFVTADSGSISNIYFQNNTCRNAGLGFGDGQRPDGENGRHIMIWQCNIHATNFYIRNNIFDTADESAIHISSSEEPYITFDYNCYNVAVICYNGYTYSTIASWRTHCGCDSNSISDNPDFVSSSDWHLTSVSPVIGHGLNVGYSSDFDLVSWNTPPSMGAYEYNSIVNPQGTYYVSTTGNDNNSGTLALPWKTLQKAFNTIVAGDIVYIRGGEYLVTSTIDISNKNGTSVNPISILNYQSEKPILNFQNKPIESWQMALQLTNCSYWNFKGLEIKNLLESGITVLGRGFNMVNCQYLTFENCIAHGICGDGFAIYSNQSKPGLITLTNCDSYDCIDLYNAGESANGFEIFSNYIGAEFSLTGCRSWHCSDDGFDYFDTEGLVTSDHCWSWSHGVGSAGDGNGMKLGAVSPYVAGVKRIVRNCIMASNLYMGFDQNAANCDKVFYNNISYNNGTNGYYLTYYCTNITMRNNISFQNGLADYICANTVHDHNSWDSSVTVTNADFISLDVNLLGSSRNSDGSLPNTTFMNLVSGSDLINAGVNVGLPYNGAAPDIGAFEYI